MNFRENRGLARCGFKKLPLRALLDTRLSNFACESDKSTAFPATALATEALTDGVEVLLKPLELMPID
jgi:hypothetical protein